jgi:hypothetical protein
MEPEFHASLVAGLCPLEVMKRAGRPKPLLRSGFFFGDDASRYYRDYSVRTRLAGRSWSAGHRSARRTTESMVLALDDRKLAEMGLTRDAVYAKVQW